MKIILALVALFCVADALITNGENQQAYPAGNFTSVNTSVPSLPCTGICVPAENYLFAGGRIHLDGGASFGGPGVFIVPASGSLRFDFDVPQKALALNAAGSTAVTLTAATLGQTVGRLLSTTSEKVVFSVNEPFDDTFTSITISVSEAVTLTIPSFRYGETGFNCIGFEAQYPCSLTVNLINIPRETAEVKVFSNVQAAQQATPLYIIQQAGGRKVMTCVPETPNSPFQTHVRDNGVVYRTETANTNQPACDDGQHKCYLDPRAVLPVPIGCLPEQALQDWYAGSSDVDLVVEHMDFIFRRIDTVTINPIVTVLAVDDITPGLQISQGLIVRTAREYNCEKGASNPITGPKQQGRCIYPLFNNVFNNFPKLTGDLVIRAKCTDQAFPPMPTGVTLTISPVANNIVYTIPERGNVDTRVCVLSFGTYNINAEENGVTTGTLQAQCSNTGTSSTCNGTPIDVVSAIFGSGCVRAPDSCGNVVPPVISAGGDAVGNYTINLYHANTWFREEKVFPYSGFATCVLNLHDVDVRMPVSPGLNINGTYDCTERQVDPNNPTTNICRRTDSISQAPLLLFNYLTIDLTGMPAGSVNYEVNTLITPDGISYLSNQLDAHPAGAFCNRGGAVEQVCVPAVDSTPIAGVCDQPYKPAVIQVYAEECGGGGSPVVSCPTLRSPARMRDDGSCIRATDETCCGLNGPCSVTVTQKLCIWDLLYLDTEYPTGSNGIVVDLLSTETSRTIRSWSNQGGSPQSYTVLAGFLKVRVSENPIGVLPDASAPHIVSDSISCKTAESCSYNDFLSILDLSGVDNVSPIACDDAHVSCSAITYNDHYSGAAVSPVLNAVTVSLYFGTRSQPFRPTSSIGSSACNGSPSCEQARANRAVVIKTTGNNLYRAIYNWESFDRTVNDIACTHKKCEAIPCLVRWAAVDPSCPDLRKQIEYLPTGVQPDNNDDPHRDLYRYSSVTTAPTITINSNSLCSHAIAVGAQTCTACVDARLDPAYAPIGYGDTDFFYRYFLLAKDDPTPYDISVHAGCASTPYQLQCPLAIPSTGVKVVLPGDSCVPPETIYWHKCDFLNLAENLQGPDQFWREHLFAQKRVEPQPILMANSCLAANNVTGRDAWIPLSPFTVVSVDLTDLSNGTVPFVDRVNLTNTPPSIIGSQQNYRGNGWVGDTWNGGGFDLLNPFELSVCCDSCGSKRESLKAEHARNNGFQCSFNAPSQCRDTQPSAFANAGGFDHLVCILAGAEYSYKVSERFRKEKRHNFLDLDPQVCPESRNLYEWNQNIINCRPNHCVVHTTTIPERYPTSEWTNTEDKLFDNIAWKHTYSTNYQCAASTDSHTLLRPNRLARPAEANIPYIKGKWYEWRVNSQFVSSHSDKFTCIDNLNPGKCFEPENDLSSTNPALRSEPQD